MKLWKDISVLRRTLGFWYLSLLFLCFGGLYILAGNYDLVQFCDGGIHFFQQTICEKGVGPLIVKMNAETLDVRAEPLMRPFSYTADLGWHIMGTDALGRDVFAGILYGGQRSLMIGLLSGVLAMVLGWFVGLWSVYFRWFKSSFSLFWMGTAAGVVLSWLTHSFVVLLFVIGLVIFRFYINYHKVGQVRHNYTSWWWSRWIEWYQALPDLLLILVLSAAIGVLDIGGLVVIIMAVVWPSMALIARRVGAEVSQQPYFRQALRNKVSGRNLMIHYLWGNTRSVFIAMLPLVVARVILLESTISFLGLGLPPDIVTIGSMISAARYNMGSWWLILFPGLFIFIVVYPLLLLGRKIHR